MRARRGWAVRRRGGGARGAAVWGLSALFWACEAAPEAPVEIPPQAASAQTAWRPARSAQTVDPLRLPASVVLSPAAQAQLSAPVEAIITAVYVQLGDPVALGAPLVQVRTPSVQLALAQVQATQARMKPIRERLEALRGLRTEGLAGSEGVYTLASQLADLEMQQRLAEAQLAASGLDAQALAMLRREGQWVLKAPIAGRVQRIDAPIGAQRGPEDPALLHLSAEGPARIVAAAARPLPAGARRVHFVGDDGRRVALAAEPLAQLPLEGALGFQLIFEGPEDLPQDLRGHLEVRAEGADLWQLPQSALWRTLEGAWVVQQSAQEPEWVEVKIVSGDGVSVWLRGELGGERRFAEDVRRLVAAGLEPPSEAFERGAGDGH